MAAPNRGYKTAIGIGEEVTLGTAVARSNWLHVYSCDLQERPVIEYIETLYQSGQPDFDEEHETLVLCGGDIEMPFLYEGFGMLLKHMMGATASTAGAGPYVHTQNRGDTWGGLTIEKIRGNSGKSELFVGCVIPSWNLTFEKGRLARVRLTILGKKANAARDTAGTPTFGGTVKARAVKGYQLSNSYITWNSANILVKRLEIGVDNKLTSTEELGSQYMSEPSRSDQGEVYVRATSFHRDETLYAAYLAGTQADLTFTYTDADDSHAFTGRNARIRSYGDPIGGTGRIERTIEWRAKADATNGALTVVTTNDQATATTN